MTVTAMHVADFIITTIEKRLSRLGHVKCTVIIFIIIIIRTRETYLTWKSRQQTTVIDLI